MNHAGEIARLAQIAAPTIALVNNAQREHLEFMATVDAVARENGAAIAALGDDGIAVFPADDAHAPTWRELAGARRTITFALDARGRRLRQRRRGTATTGSWRCRRRPARRRFALHVAGAHNVRNALAASAAALAAGCPLEAIVRGLEGFVAVRGRSQAKRFARGGVERHAGRRHLQRQSRFGARRDRRPRRAAGAALARPRRHGRGRRPGAGVPPRGRRLRRASAASSRCGRRARKARTRRRRSPARAPSPTSRRCSPRSARRRRRASVLVKGSRFMRMERVVAALVGEPAETPCDSGRSEAHAA